MYHKTASAVIIVYKNGDTVTCFPACVWVFVPGIVPNVSGLSGEGEANS